MPDPERLPDRLDLALVMCPPWGYRFPPIGLAYLSTTMRAAGYRVEVHDLNADVFRALESGPFTHLWGGSIVNAASVMDQTEQFFDLASRVFARSVDRIVNARARVVGFSIHSRNVWVAERMAAMIRARLPETVILYGGPEVTSAHVGGVLGGLHADGFVLGEGEVTLREIFRGLDERERLAPTPGLILSEDRDREAVRREPVKDLDEIPFPTYEEFDLRVYDCYDVEGIACFLPFLYSRGCNNTCAFCIDHRFEGRYRARSAENAVAEMEHHKDHYGADFFAFSDLTCNGSLPTLERFCDVLAGRGLGVRWSSFATIRRGMTPELYRKMAKSGCCHLTFGLESGSDSVLRRMRKRYDRELAAQVLRDCTQAGIKASVNLLVGFPGETREEHKETLDFLRENRRWIDSAGSIGACHVIPGSAISDEREAFGVGGDARPGGEWTDALGTDRAERHRRLVEVCEVLRELGIPAPGELTPEHDGEAAEAPVHIDAVRLLDARGEERAEFDAGETVIVRIGFAVRETVPRAVVRVQLFNDENPLGRAVFVFGMNNERLGRPLAPVERGEYEAEFVFDHPTLGPGAYRILAGIWPDEQAPAAFDVRVRAAVLRVTGEPDPAGAKAAIPRRWEEPAALDGEPALANALTGFRITNAHGLPTAECDTRGAVRFVVDYHADRPGRFSLTVLVEADGVAFARLVRPDPLPGGHRSVAVACDPITLLAGDYEVSAALVDRADGQLRSQVRARLRVTSGPADGGGCVRLPCSWRSTGPKGA